MALAVLRKLSVVFLLFALLGCCTPARSQCDPVQWYRAGDQATLYIHGYPAGVLVIPTRTYRQLLRHGLGEPVPCPVAIPAELLAPVPSVPTWQASGILEATTSPRVSISGPTDPGELERRGSRPAPLPGPSPSPTPEPDPVAVVPHYEQQDSITVVTADKALRDRIAGDLAAAPELAKYRTSCRIHVYDPANPLVAEFKLAEDPKYKESGLAILYQPPPGPDHSAPVRSLYEYTGPAELAAALEAIQSQTEPDGPTLTPWTRTHVGVGVGLAVAAVLSVFFGVSLKWYQPSPA